MTGADRLSREQLAAWAPFAAVLEMLPAQVNSGLQKSVGHSLISLCVLGHLSEDASRAAGISEIAACTNTTLPRMSRVVARLEADGLVARSDCSGDGRAVNITLTGDGARALREAMPGHDAVVRENVLSALSPEQLEQLRVISETLLAHLHPDARAPLDRQRPSRQ